MTKKTKEHKLKVFDKYSQIMKTIVINSHEKCTALLVVYEEDIFICKLCGHTDIKNGFKIYSIAKGEEMECFLCKTKNPNGEDIIVNLSEMVDK